MAESIAGLTARPFESDHLGGPVFDCSDPNHALEAVARARKAGAILVSCRTDGDGEALAKAGFRQVETLVTFERSTEGVLAAEAYATVRAGGRDDIDACRSIASTALRYDRFHADPRIDDRKADGLKADWIENDLRGRADVTLVAETAGDVGGFCAMLLRPAFAVIDLIAVAPNHQGRGLGRAMVAAALDRYRGQVPSIQVGTQAANPQSLKFYQSVGFVEIRRANTWHWMPEGP